jgi:transaldolase
MKTLSDLSIKIYADGADKESMFGFYGNPLIKGMTTNPTLMRKAGIQNYENFAKEILQTIKDKPISFEVFSDDFAEMKRQALRIKDWQNNVYVKIPVTNTEGKSSTNLIKELSQEGVQLNITAIMTEAQVEDILKVLSPSVRSVISIFAGRIADTGQDPVPIMKSCKKLLASHPKAELLWASVREILNIFHAQSCGCDIVTVPHEILNKALKWCGQDLTKVSLDTVVMFRNDALAAGFNLD